MKDIKKEAVTITIYVTNFMRKVQKSITLVDEHY